MSDAQTAQLDSNAGFGKLLAVGRNLWLAGLGAVAEVEEEGRGLFGRLVERGRPLDEKQRRAVETLAGRATRTAREFGKLVQDTVEYESRGMLERLNLMTRKDVQILSTRLTTSSQKIDEYAERRQAAADPETPKAAARPRQRKNAR